jgi:hypothetical protein
MLAALLLADQALPSTVKFDLTHPSAPWFMVSTAGGSPSGSGSLRVMFSRRTTTGANGEVLADPPPIWIVRRETSQTWTMGARAGQTEKTVKWIDGRTCPALPQVMDGLDALPPVKPFRWREIKDAYIGAPPTHSGGWNLTMWGRAGDSPAGATLTDLSGDTVGKWWVRANKTLEPCWRDEEPAYP